MRIEYVLIEKQNDQQQNPSKRRIVGLLKNQFPDMNSRQKKKIRS